MAIFDPLLFAGRDILCDAWDICMGSLSASAGRDLTHNQKFPLFLINLHEKQGRIGNISVEPFARIIVI